MELLLIVLHNNLDLWTVDHFLNVVFSNMVALLEVEVLNIGVNNCVQRLLKFEELIDELRQNYCIVIVTHSMQQAARVSQLTAFFHLGTLVEVGDTEAIFTNPQERRTQDYIMGRFG